MYSFRDLFFENHPIEMAMEKNKYVEEKKQALVEKFEAIDGNNNNILFNLIYYS